MGYPFYITGKVIKGDQIGRKIGFPTANIVVEERYKLIPSDGIYSVKVKIGFETFFGMGYIGSRPTVMGQTRNIEVNLFNFDAEIYNQTVQVEFYNFIRGDSKFEGLDALKAQIAKDKIAVQTIFGLIYIKSIK